MRRVLKWAALALGGVIALVLTALIAVRLYYTDARLFALVRAEVQAQVPFPVQIGGVSLELLSGVVVRGVVVGPPTPAYKEDVLRLPELRLGYRLWPLLQRHLAVDELSLVKPVIVLEMQDGTWNAEALADAFKSDAPKEPEPPASDPQALGLSVDLAAMSLIDLQLAVRAPTQTLDLDRINARVAGVYTGDTASAKVHFYIGEDGNPAALNLALGDVATAKLRLLLDVGIDAASLYEAVVAVRIHAESMQGEVSGFALPPLPFDLQMHAAANLLTSHARVDEFVMSLGEAVRVAAAASVDDWQGDPDVLLEHFNVDVDVRAALALLPPGMVPVRVKSGKVSLSRTGVHARLSTLKARDPVDAKLSLALQDIAFDQDALSIAGLRGKVELAVVHDSGVHLDFALTVAHLAQDVLQARGVRLDGHVDAPISLLQQRLDEALRAHITLFVPSIDQAPNLHFGNLRLALDVNTSDLSAAVADVRLNLGIDSVRLQDAKLGEGSYPLSLSLALTRRAPHLGIDTFSLVMADWLRLGLQGSVSERAGGSFDVVLNATFADLDLGKIAPLAPSALQRELAAMALTGTANMSLGVKGRIPADLGTRLKQPLPVMLDEGTPFDLDMQLGWQGVGLQSGESTLKGSAGALSVQTHPHREAMQLETSIDSLSVRGENAIDIADLGLSFDVHQHKAQTRAKGTLTLGSTQAPRLLKKTLNATSIDFAAVFTRGAALLLDHLNVSVPTIGTTVDLRARIAHPEEAYASEAWKSPTLAGLGADATLDIKVALPEKNMQLLPDKALKLSGGFGFKLAVGVSAAQVKVDGALRTTHLDVDIGGLVVRDMNGTFPFLQAFTKTTTGSKLVLSAQDILRDQPRVAYYTALRSYGGDKDGLRIDRVQSGKNTIDKIALNGRIDSGRLLLDYFAMKLLSGEVEGQLDAQLGADKIFRLGLGAQFSQLDLSELSRTPPGPESQINGNMQVRLEWAEKYPRELDQSTFNITRVGSRMLTALVRGLDPEGKNESLTNTRKKIETWNANINLFKVAVNHNTADIDIETKTIFSAVGINLIERAAARRLDIKPRLEGVLGDTLDEQLGPWLGWKNGSSK